MTQPPTKIGQTRIVKALNRGFYGAAYLGKAPPFDALRVVKVVPKELYQKFGKDFEDECKRHHKFAQTSTLVADISNFGEETVDFQGRQIECHFAEIEYIPGDTLEDILSRDEPTAPLKVAQIAIDLYSLLIELERASLHHNDLHAGNIIIQNLPPATFRADAVESTVMVRAIDLGSLSELNASVPEEARVGDIRWVARHINELCQKILRSPDLYNESDYQLADLLANHCYLINHPETHLRKPSLMELIAEIRQNVVAPVERPWNTPLKLNRFEDYYNAQTLNSWHVPSLLVDPNGIWLSRISIKGPQLITGMRGCGKTMVLRSADFHARAAQYSTEDPEKVASLLSSDGFLGLYCSATRLLGGPERKFEKLFISYARAAVNAATHMEDVTNQKISSQAVRGISSMMTAVFNGLTWNEEIYSLDTLSRKLRTLQAEVENPAQQISLKLHPSKAFQLLATTIRECSPPWNTAYILFLLDDVSTRYLSEDEVRNLVSELLFQSNECAFKFTTESQTLELVLQAPGQNSPAWHGRDYQVFDLGYEVNTLLKSKSSMGGTEDFLVSVLKQRAEYYRFKPAYDPKEILGDTPLERIAQEIAGATENDAKKKEVYRGLSALRGVCVGDLGDAILLYDEILRKGKSSSDATPTPIPAKIQSEAFQNHCSRKIYDLHRRESFLKDVALSFAKASKQLLDSSQKKRSAASKGRLRQYTKLYVQLSGSNINDHTAKLRKLIDAGVFVLEGGTETPRTKTRDSDPITQFKLSFRKLFGISSFMPLSDRDRFELSGDQLDRWLKMSSPDEGAAILSENLTSSEDEEEEEQEQIAIKAEFEAKRASTVVANPQPEFVFDQSPPPSTQDITTVSAFECPSTFERLPTFLDIDLETSAGVKDLPSCLLIGLGFETRCLESLKYYIDRASFQEAICVEYAEAGQAEAILRLLKERGLSVRIVKYSSDLDLGALLSGKDVFVDITGLATPAIFQSIRSILKSGRRAFVTHGFAAEYYPSNEAIAEVLEADERADVYVLLEKLSGLWSGEDRPYHLIGLIEQDGDVLRERALCAFVGAKHERLFTLIEERDADVIYLATPKGTTPRCKLAALAAEIASKERDRTLISQIDSSSAIEAAEWLIKAYGELMLQEGASIEVGLAGAKDQVVAAAVVSTVAKLGACWYVQPERFDPARFTLGYSSNRSYVITPNLNLES